VREATLPEAASRAAFQEAAAQAAAAVGDQFINVLLNVDHDTHKLMIIKLVSNIDLRRSIEEVLSTVPIISQATFNKSTVNWEECTPPYAVDMRSFRKRLWSVASLFYVQTWSCKIMTQTTTYRE
jgi:hypothetical protein